MHWSITTSLEEYVQETGQYVRDGGGGGGGGAYATVKVNAYLNDAMSYRYILYFFKLV